MHISVLAFNRRVLCFTVLFFLSCGSNNIATPYTKLTLKEKARIALDQEDFDTAVKFYNEWIVSNPEDYESYRFLAAAYAGAGGFSVFGAIKGLAESAGDSSSSVTEVISSLIPSEPSEIQTSNMSSAINQILELPAAYRVAGDESAESAKSASLQLSLYRTALSIMILKRYTKQIKSQVDQDSGSIEEMTDEEIDLLFSNLEAAVLETSNESMKESLEKTLADIDAQQGSSQKEKLANYVKAD